MLGIKKMSKYHLDNHLRTLHHNTHLHLQQPGSCAHPTKEKKKYIKPKIQMKSNGGFRKTLEDDLCLLLGRPFSPENGNVRFKYMIIRQK